MTAMYQPPLTVGFNSPGLGNLTNSNMAVTRSPFFTVANQFLPRNLHDVIRWARYITTQSPVTTEVIRKLATYPVTDFVIETEKEATRKKYKELFKSFKLRSVLHDVGFEYYTLGNVFVSIYFPIHRTLVCGNCAKEFNAKNAEFTKFVDFQFEGQCPACNSKAKFSHKDTKGFDVDEMNIVKWDPTHIAVSHNPITNEYEYYYKIPNDIKRRVKQGDKLLVNSIPWNMIEAIRLNQDFKFDKNNIFHLKNLSTGQLVEGVSIPPLISQFSLVFYQATLRRANESVAQDYMAPLRVIYPQAQTGNADPVVSLSMRNFAANMQQALIKHKQDNNHVVIAPVPVGYEAISGEGKNLLVTQEIAQAEESILLSLGVSRELLSGTTNWTSSTVGLRMLENTMLTYVAQIQDLIEWIINRTTKYLTLETCTVTLIPFKLTDDENLKEVLLKLYSDGKTSISTLLEGYGINYEDELKKVREDLVAESINSAKIKMEVDRAVFLAAKQMSDKFDQNNDYKTALAKAQAIVEQLIVQDPTTVRQVLNTYQIEDFSMYLLVSKLLEEATMQNQAAQVGPDGQPLEQQGGQPGQPGQPEQSQQESPSGPGPDSSQPAQPNAGSTPKV